MPPHLNGDGTDEISDSTDFKEYIFNTKSSVKSRAFLLQAIRASNKKYSKVFRAAAYHPHAKQKILWNFHSSYHHCRRHCHCIAATQIKSYLPPRLLPSSRRHRLTDTSSLHQQCSHRRIAKEYSPPSFGRQFCRQRQDRFRQSEYVPSRCHGKCRYNQPRSRRPYRRFRFASAPCRKEKKRPTTAQMQKPVVKELGRQRLPLAAPNQRHKSSRAEVPPHPRRPRRNEEGPPHRALVTLPVRRHLLHRVLNSCLQRDKKN